MKDWWLVFRIVFERGGRPSLSTLLSLGGMVLGVGTLVMTMSIMSGVETFLQKSIVDVTGHVFLIRPSGSFGSLENLERQIKEHVPSLVGVMPFVHVEAVLAHEGTISGVAVQGIDLKSSEVVLNLRPRVIEGVYDLRSETGPPAALLGKEIVKKFGLRLGNVVKIVIQKSNYKSATGFSPRLREFRYVGSVDLGKYEYNSRLVITSNEAVQELMGVGTYFTGVRLKLDDAAKAREAAFTLNRNLGGSFVVRDWYEVNRNYFKAIEIEKGVIFAVLCFMVIIAAFNMSSTLSMNILRRFRDIAILKAMGASEKFLVRLFVRQGLLVGSVGVLLGIFFGLVSSYLVTQLTWLYVPGEIYKFDRLPVDVRVSDVLSVGLISLLICWVSSLRPALRGAALNPVQGLRYE